MTIPEILTAFIKGMKETGPIEYIAVFAGIISVWYSRKENILVYPIGLINTIFYVYLSFKGGLLGEASVNLYYTIMSIYGWMIWSRRDADKKIMLHITASSKKEWMYQLMFFGVFFVVIYFLLTYLKKDFAPGAIPWADALASASAYTGMWLMTRKKLESWIWWIITNIASIPLYFIKQYVFTSVYYVILLIMAIAGLIEWNKRLKQVAHEA
ncbi:MAG TPA: nicotinamide riboside transporter PnuC [Ferruginibacter sp.]|nr:nicotinamide riboside transporter PnuC [Ferruginibacter sp.]